MALIELLTKSEIESSDSSIAASFLTSTLRSLFSAASPAAGRESDNDSKLKHISLDEVSYHDASDDCWIIIYDRVYDVTDFLRQHPGGFDVLLENAGRDCTQAFRGHSNDAVLSMKKFEIGILPPQQRIYRFPGMIRISDSKPE